MKAIPGVTALYIKQLKEQIEKLKEQNANYEFALKLLVDELNKLKEEQ